ncbi:dephospho-CoA kinase [Robiginitalea sediminis]|uniref:dephospho-CoA kinase n=1 Tax=Robiginitalea sediminis TaxID=1982593 RepID=UPI000B4BC90C|nr:dephospho-CoA kinase [Robiginitalea sediminis]
MMRVGLTGGIGSGKSTVAAFFEDLGIPVYNSDAKAKALMAEDKTLQKEIIGLLGEEAFTEGLPNREYIASQVFPDPERLGALNALVHPAVRKDFDRWAGEQQTPYVIQEAAILFETGGYRNMDHTILVTAPEQERIRRVMQRDGAAEAAVRVRMERQWDDARKAALADFVVHNLTLPHTRQQVEQLHRQLLKLSYSAGPGDC